MGKIIVNESENMNLKESQNILIEDYINELKSNSDYLKNREDLYDNIVYLGPYILRQNCNKFWITSVPLKIAGIWFPILIWTLSIFFTLCLYHLSHLVFLWSIPFMVAIAFIVAGCYRVKTLSVNGKDWFVYDKNTNIIEIPRENISFSYSDILAVQSTQSRGPDTYGCMLEILVVFQNQIQRQPIVLMLSRREQKMINTVASILEKDLILEQYNWKGQKRIIRITDSGRTEK